MSRGGRLRYLVRGGAILLGATMLIACGRTPTPTPTIALHQGSLACFGNLDTGTPTATPQISRAQAEAAVRASYASSRKNVTLGQIVDARYAGIVASGVRHPQTGADELAGRAVWLIGFSDGTDRRYALIDASSGQFLSGCGGPESSFGTPTP